MTINLTVPKDRPDIGRIDVELLVAFLSMKSDLLRAHKAIELLASMVASQHGLDGAGFKAKLDAAPAEVDPAVVAEVKAFADRMFPGVTFEIVP